ncbi:hypothetical protein ACH5RR_021457 [Cinchona calisaya]|uniref:Uncharacterized protein n=1 Tax=Cinchona calisaya TaxID=153742 RepID=A0ABD2ZMB2_9GENT
MHTLVSAQQFLDNDLPFTAMFISVMIFILISPLSIPSIRVIIPSIFDRSAILSGLKQHSKTSKGMLEAKFGGKIPLKNLGPQKKYSRMEDYFDGSSDDDYYDRVYDDDEEVEGEDSNGLQEAKDKTDFSMSCD